MSDNIMPPHNGAKVIAEPRYVAAARTAFETWERERVKAAPGTKARTWDGLNARSQGVMISITTNALVAFMGARRGS